MAEEWGTVVFKASDEVAQVFKAASGGDARSAVERLAEAANVEISSLANADCRVGETSVSGGYLGFGFDCSDWSRISNLFVSQGDGIEFYFRGQDEYGTAEFFALTASGERFGFAFDQGGDAWDQDGYEDKVIAKLDEWKSKVPDGVENAFPGFTLFDDLEFDGP